LQSLLIQLGVKECIIPDDKTEKDVELSKLRMVIDRCDCVVTTRKRSEFSGKDIEQDLERLLRSTEIAINTLPELDKKLAMGSTSAVINYLSLLNDPDNFGQYTLRTHDLAQFLRLDNSALRALSLFPELGATGHAKSMSVYGLLNKCKTAQGTRMLAQWLKQPLRNLHMIRECIHAALTWTYAHTNVSDTFCPQRSDKTWSSSFSKTSPCGVSCKMSS
jgi:DNA mismatch repair protein MSH2